MPGGLTDTALYPLIPSDARILVTGAGGFIGRRVVTALLARGFTNIAALRRPVMRPRDAGAGSPPGEDPRVVLLEGNLLSREDCSTIAAGARLIYHLAAGRGEKSFPDAYLNSVVTTRNLLEACPPPGCLQRFVNVSSFTVYTNRDKPRGRLLDEACPVERYPNQRGAPYCFAKVKQEEMVADLGRRHALPYVTVRPGVVYGPGNERIHGRVGLDSFGLFLHFGGSNPLPLSYVDNCADAIVLAGLVPGVEGEVFNVVDDDLPSSRQFLRLYKERVARFPSIYVPHALSYALSYAWERYARWSRGQLPNAFNRSVWHSTWKRTIYTNEKLKRRLGWVQAIPTREGLERHFASCREQWPRG